MKNGSLTVFKTENFNRRNILWTSDTDTASHTYKRPFYTAVNPYGSVIIYDSFDKLVWSSYTEWIGVPNYTLTIQSI